MVAECSWRSGLSASAMRWCTATHYPWVRVFGGFVRGKKVYSWSHYQLMCALLSERGC